MAKHPLTHHFGHGRRGLSALVVTVVAGQILIPAYFQLFTTDPAARFSWQMYTSTDAGRRVDAVDNNGQVSEFNRFDIRTQRLDIRLDDKVLSQACAVRPNIVEFRSHETGKTIVRCDENT